MNLQPAADDEDDNGRECLICYEKREELGILESCQHVFCSPCLRVWRDNGRIMWNDYDTPWDGGNCASKGSTFTLFKRISFVDRVGSSHEAPATGITCPCCTVRSNVALYTDRAPTSSDEKSRMFRDYRISAMDLLLSNMVGMANIEWEILVRMLLSTHSSECLGIDGFEIDAYAERNSLDLFWNGRHHASFWSDSGDRSLVCFRIEGLTVQLLLTTEDSTEEDNIDTYAPIGGIDCKMADIAVTCLLELVEKSSWRELLPALNPRHEEFLMVRMFKLVTCALYVKRTGRRDSAQSGLWDEARHDLLWNLPSHNFVRTLSVAKCYGCLDSNHRYGNLQRLKTLFF